MIYHRERLVLLVAKRNRRRAREWAPWRAIGVLDRAPGVLRIVLHEIRDWSEIA